jgi:sRNA-binding carbon storage regulator CsrA
LDLSQTVEQLFTSGPIEITLLDVGQNQVKIAIDAPPALKIWRGPSRQGSGTVPGTKDAA